MRTIIDSLRSNHTLHAEEYHKLIACSDEQIINYLHQQARGATLEKFGNQIYIRGLLEISNCCTNNCYYCGIRKGNKNVKRYSLDKQTILDSCRKGHGLGFRTFVLQGGETTKTQDEKIIETIKEIHALYPDCAITLSLGEKPYETYLRFYEAGANRYLLRHETKNEDHYTKLHPLEMSPQNRLRSLEDLRKIGYQAGTGIMVGSPYQTIDNLVEDILFIEKFQPQMIGIGPFIPHEDTPFASYPAGSVRQTLILISILRLMNPNLLIPSTTALNSIDPKGRMKGILAGANVLMPNLTPIDRRKDYSLYNNKSSLGIESAEGLKELRDELSSIGYEVSTKKGDYVQN
jgi:iron-only hydrogenase maturation rSAM protein HydE